MASGHAQGSTCTLAYPCVLQLITAWLAQLHSTRSIPNRVCYFGTTKQQTSIINTMIGPRPPTSVTANVPVQ